MLGYLWEHTTYIFMESWKKKKVSYNYHPIPTIWAPSSESVSSSIPSWQISTAHAQPFRGARDLAFYLKVPLDSLLVWASSKGSGDTARMRRLAWTFAAHIGDKYQIRLTRSISVCQVREWLLGSIHCDGSCHILEGHFSRTIVFWTRKYVLETTPCDFSCSN